MANQQYTFKLNCQYSNCNYNYTHGKIHIQNNWTSSQAEPSFGQTELQSSFDQAESKSLLSQFDWCTALVSPSYGA